MNRPLSVADLLKEAHDFWYPPPAGITDTNTTSLHEAPGRPVTTKPITAAAVALPPKSQPKLPSRLRKPTAPRKPQIYYSAGRPYNDQPSDPPTFEFTSDLSPAQRHTIRSITQWQRPEELSSVDITNPYGHRFLPRKLRREKWPKNSRRAPLTSSNPRRSSPRSPSNP